MSGSDKEARGAYALWLVGCGFALGCTFVAVSYHILQQPKPTAFVQFLETSDGSTWAAWAQAIGTVVAITSTIGIGRAQLHAQRDQFNATLTEQRRQALAVQKRLVHQKAIVLRGIGDGVLRLRATIDLGESTEGTTGAGPGLRISPQSEAWQLIELPNDIALDLPEVFREELKQTVQHVISFRLAAILGVEGNPGAIFEAANKAVVSCFQLAAKLEDYALSVGD